MTDKRDEEGDSMVLPDWQYRDIPTIYADLLMGKAFAVGVERVVLGELLFNPTDGATLPTYRPVLNLVMTRDNLRTFAAEILKAYESEESIEQSS